MTDLPSRDFYDARVSPGFAGTAIEYGYQDAAGGLTWPDSEGDLADFTPDGGYLPARFEQGNEWGVHPALLDALRESATAAGRSLVCRLIGAPAPVQLQPGQIATVRGEVIAVDHDAITIRVPR